MLAAQDAVGSAGPLLAILGFLVLPLIWSVPEAMITAELATAFPENSGYVAYASPHAVGLELDLTWCPECAPSSTRRSSLRSQREKPTKLPQAETCHVWCPLICQTGTVAAFYGYHSNPKP